MWAQLDRLAALGNRSDVGAFALVWPPKINEH